MIGVPQPVSDPLDEWRSAASAVRRAWYEWLAAERAERRRAHAVYLAALVAEERAAHHAQQRLTELLGS
jgi:hypothetical protein